jgi:nicotinamidase-related amidase
MSELLEVEYSRRRERLLRSRAALLLIDIQERLLAAMSDEVASKLLRNTKLLIVAAGRLGVPIVVSQQYPKGLGQTVPELRDTLAQVEDSHGATVYRFDKTEFSCAANDAFCALPPAMKQGPLMQREQWLVCGMETHVCVYQTVRDLVGPACAVHVVADAVASRTKSNWRIGIELCRESGARITSAETVVFDLLAKAASDEFKELSRLIK